MGEPRGFKGILIKLKKALSLSSSKLAAFRICFNWEMAFLCHYVLVVTTREINQVNNTPYFISPFSLICFGDVINVIDTCQRNKGWKKRDCEIRDGKLILKNHFVLNILFLKKTILQFN